MAARVPATHSNGPDAATHSPRHPHAAAPETMPVTRVGSEGAFAGLAFDVSQIAGLQRVMGNQATVKLLERQRTPGSSVERKSTGPLVRANQVQRVVTGGMTKQAFIAELTGTPASRQKLQNIPSTGMGRFDVEYDVAGGRLIITVRPFMQFGNTVDNAFVPGGWSASAQKKMFAAFKSQCEAAWSGKFTFSCQKVGWTDLVVTPIVRVERAASLADGHFDVKISKDKSVNTGFGREQMGDPTGATKNVGNFADQDVKKRAHDKASQRCSMANHDEARLSHLIEVYGIKTIHFDAKGNITDQDRVNLIGFVQAVNKSALPGSVPVPLILTGADVAKGKPKKLAEAVASAMKAAGMKKNPLTVRTMELLIKSEKKKMAGELAAHEKNEDKLKTVGYRPGGALHTEAKAHIADLETHQNDKRVEIEVDAAFKNSWKGDPYSILAHEFGHMLGNPDEYFQGGEEVLKLRIATLTTSAAASGDADKQRELAEAQAELAQGKFDAGAGDKNRLDIQQNYGTLVQGAGFEVQKFNTSPTSSIMSAGADLLPQHYVTLWEALGRITDPAITQGDWKVG